MDLADNTYVPPLFYFQIQQGAHFHLEFPPFVDATTGVGFNFTTDPAGTWTARMNVVTSTGTILVKFATSGESGVVTLDSEGVCQLDLADDYTVALNPTTAPVLADLVLVDPTDSEKWVHAIGKGQIRKQVTS